MQEYVQKSTRTTFPRSSSIVSGVLLIHSLIARNGGAAPKSGSFAAWGLTLAARATPPPECVKSRSSRFATLERSTGFWSALV